MPESPRSPRTFTELEAAFKKIQAKGQTPVTSGFKEWWVYKHLFNHFMGAETKDMRGPAASFIAGTTHFKDHPALLRYFDLVDLLVKYGLPRPLEVDFNAEMSAIGSHKVAMITGQGNWAEDGITKIDPSIQLGMLDCPSGMIRARRGSWPARDMHGGSTRTPRTSRR